jgi:sulfonate transport system permease protein
VTATATLPARRALRGAVLPLLLLTGWQAASASGLVDARILPPLEAVAATALREVAEGRLAADLAASLARDLAGLTIGATAGLALGTLLGLSRVADRLLGPSFDALKQIAIFAWIPLISMWFGVGEAAKVVFVAVAAFTPVVVNTCEGVRGAARQLVEVGAILTFTKPQLVARVFLPSALPSVLTGLHLALIFSWLATVGAEYFMSVGPGIGGLIVEGRERFQMDLVLLGVLVLGLVGWGLNRLAALAESRLVRWRPAQPR